MSRMFDDYSLFSVADLKNVIRDYKKKMCPPFSKLTRASLIEVIEDLNIK